MKILVCNNVFHSVMGDSEPNPPETQTIDGLVHESITVPVTDSLRAFYPSCIWDGVTFSEPAIGKLTPAEVAEYWQMPDEIYAND